jgi:hypothetical protein
MWLEYEFTDAKASATLIQNLVDHADSLGVFCRVDYESGGATVLVESPDEGTDVQFLFMAAQYPKYAT